MEREILLVYISKSNATKYYAELISQELNSRNFDVKLVNLKKESFPKNNSYKNIIIGTGIRIGMVYWKAKRILKRDEIKNKNVALFLSSGIAVEDVKKSREKFLEPLVKKYNLNLVHYDALPGNIPDDKGKLKSATDPESAKLWIENYLNKLNNL